MKKNVPINFEMPNLTGIDEAHFDDLPVKHEGKNVGRVLNAKRHGDNLLVTVAIDKKTMEKVFDVRKQVTYDMFHSHTEDGRQEHN